MYRNHPNNYNKGFVKNSYTLLCAARPHSRLPDLSELIYVKEPPRHCSASSIRGLFSWIHPVVGSDYSRASLQEERAEHPQPEVSSGLSGRWSSSGGGSFRSCAEGEFPPPERGRNLWYNNNASNPAGGDLGAVSIEGEEARGASSEAAGASASPSVNDADEGVEEAKAFDGARGADSDAAGSGTAGIVPEGAAAAWKKENGSPSPRSSSPLVGLAFTSSPRSAFDLDASGNGSAGGSSCEGPQAGEAHSPLDTNGRAGGVVNSMGSTRADGDAGGSHSSGELWYLANSMSSAVGPASVVSPERGTSGAGTASVFSDDSKSVRSLKGEGSRREKGHAGNPEEFTNLLSDVSASEMTPTVGLEHERNPRYGGADSDIHQPRAALESRYQGSALPS